MMNFDFENNDYLPGVYNYCDRWCNRCIFNSRCMVNATEEQVKDSLPIDKRDDNLEYIKVIFQSILEMLKDFSEREGINWDYQKDDEDYEEEEENNKIVDENLSNLPLLKSTMKYLVDSNSWLRENNKRFKNLFESLKIKLDSESGNDKNWDELFKIKDTIEIITHYSAFIHVKLFRAHSASGNDEYENNEENNDEADDQNISAHLALIGINRSIFAWDIISELLHDFDYSIKKILNNLRRIKVEVEMKFPEAINYKRPYFDEKF